MSHSRTPYLDRRGGAVQFEHRRWIIVEGLAEAPCDGRVRLLLDLLMQCAVALAVLGIAANRRARTPMEPQPVRSGPALGVASVSDPEQLSECCCRLLCRSFLPFAGAQVWRQPVGAGGATLVWSRRRVRPRARRRGWGR